MLRAIRFSFLLLYLLFNMLGAIASNIDSANKFVGLDTLPRKFYFFDNDSICYALIDSSRIVKSTIIEDSVMSKYVSDSYNWNEPRVIKVDSKHFDKIKIRKQPSIWIFYILLAIVIYFTFIKNLFNKSLPVIFQAYWNDRSINQFTRDDNFFKSRNSIYYFVLFSMVYATIAYFIIDYFGYSMPSKGLDLYYLIITVLTIFYTAKYLLMKLIGYIFSVQRLISGYLAIISVSNLVFSVLSIPFLIFFNYVNAEYK
ncbi:MAG: DUF4271 domain-containing protein, partial [bacterium]